MKKSLIALTLAALPVAAMADVTLYGQIKAGVEVGQTKFKTPEGTQKDHTTSEIADFGSRIGFKGHEHLADNLNAIWQLEQEASVAGNKSGWGTRESFIGLEGGFGKIRAGKLDSSVKNTSDAIDPWEYSNPALGLGMFTRVDERAVSVRYDTPVFGGFSANVQYTPRDNGAAVRGINPTVGIGPTNPTNGRDAAAGDTSTYYAGLNYENAGFFGQYAYGYKHAAYVARKSGESKSGQIHRAVVGYDANNLLAAVAYQYTNGWDSKDSYMAALRGDGERTDDEIARDISVGLKQHEAAATVGYRFGNVTPRISYAHGFKAKGAELTQDQRKATEYNQVIVGADYDFSKRTSALVSAGWLNAGKGNYKTETTAGMVGLRHKF
ncbi:porin [Neisseria brasiliensis]|uniref:trimeric porin PorB n=1 Tax=Neisseria TaxID=482 RepID=UPI000C27EC81|nr:MULTISPECIES: trimeric porin PorB [Neisseria]PJO78177.1 porin [Neisseria sp. N177_16]QGL24618.1 porin [Neisseria brasiliensis]